MLKLRRLKVNQYRSVAPCDLVFHDGINVLLGPNGGGKTTLLKLLTLLYREPFATLGSSEAIDVEVELAFPDGQMSIGLAMGGGSRTEVSRRAAVPGGFRVQITLNLHEHPSFWATCEDATLRQWELRGDKGTVKVFFAYPDEMGVLTSLTLLLQKLWVNDSGPDLDPKLHDRLVRLYGAKFPLRFDESLDLFQDIPAHVIKYESDPIPGHPHWTRPRGISPLSLLAHAGHSLSRKTTRLCGDSDTLPFLKTFVTLTGLSGASLEGDLIERPARDLSSNAFSLLFSRLRFSFTRADGSLFPQEHLSYGQKRLLTFLYYLDAIPQVVIADELVNGLHHGWIRSCLDAIGDRQAFLTSQNPLLMDCLWFESQEHVQRSLLLCNRTKDQDQGAEQMVWRNLSADEAESFYRAYQVGVQHVGEILQVKGLW